MKNTFYVTVNSFFVLFVLLSNVLHAQMYNYGTGSIGSNPTGFNTTGTFAGYSISGNDFSTTGNLTITLPANPGPNPTIYQFANFTVNTGHTVTFSGINAGPVIIRCTGTMTINGTINCAGGNGQNGATSNSGGFGGTGGGGGGRTGGTGAWQAAGANGNPFGGGAAGTGGAGRGGASSTTIASGGGGGSYGADGGGGWLGSGTQQTSTGLGSSRGIQYGDVNLTATLTQSGFTTNLLGGSGGGAGGGRSGGLTQWTGAGGGGGGGAIQITANTVTIGSQASAITVAGGNGGNNTTSAGAAGACGGGGSGGTINLQYFNYTNGLASNLVISGGLGGTNPISGQRSDGGNGGNGRLLLQQDVVLCTAPTTQATSFSYSNVTTSSTDITFNRGNGDGGVLVVARAGAAPQAPMGGTSYTANPIFGSGSTTAAGSFVVYNSNAAGPVTFNVSGLTPGTTYQFSVHEWNTTATCYLNPGLIGTVPIPVCLPPSTQASAASATPAVHSATLNWTPGSGTGGQLVVLRQATAVSGDPIQTTTYTDNSIFGSGTALGGGFVVHGSNGGSVNISNLIENTTYHYAIYSFNTSGPCYTLPALTGSFTTLNGPMSYVSSTNVQQTGNSPLGSTNQPILRFEVVGGPGTSPALTVGSITFNTTGTTNPANLTGARIYFTGSSTTFSTINPFGVQVNNPSGSHVVNGSQVLAPGSNYFWLVYDVSIGATTGNLMDAQITSVNTGSDQTPTVIAPAGTRTITSLMALSCGYTYSNFSATWTSNVGQSGTTVVASGAAAIDDQRWPSQNFTSGFTFEYNGVVYSTFGLHSKGYIWFGATNPSGLTAVPISTATAYDGAIAAFAFDMVAHSASTTTPQVTVRYTGSAPNRVCIIEWTAFRPWNNTGGICPGFGSPTDWNRYDIQLHLHENGGTNSNRIDIILRDMNGFCINANGASAQVGLRGTTNADFLNRAGTGNTGHTASSAGTLNTSVISHGANNYFNGNGGLRFTPTFQKPVVTPSPTATNTCPALDVVLSTTSPVTTKQWYNNNLPISGATGANYTANANGTHILLVTQDGCSKVSDPIVVTIQSCCQTVFGVDKIESCEPITWIDGITYTASNNTAQFNIVGGSINGCDSLVTLDFTLSFPTAGTATITSCEPITWIDGNTYTTSNNTATFNIIGGSEHGCDSLVTLNLTIVPNSEAPSSINSLYSLCVGGSTVLELVGGSLAPGTDWEWFQGSCGSTVIGTGTTLEVEPSANTTYYVRASAGNSCAPSTCQSITVNMPSATPNLSIDGDDATCYIYQNGWVHFYNASGRLIASVHSNGQNLGQVTASSLVAASPYTIGSCAEPTNSSFLNAAMARTFVITPEFQPTAPVSIRLYFLNSEFTDYQAHALTTTSNPNDDVLSIGDMNMTRVSGGNNDGDPTNNCGLGTQEFVLQTGSGTMSTLANFSNFANTAYIEFEVNGFSEFLPMDSDNSPLPVTLTQFNANCLDEQVRVNWTTASEFNASHYNLQNSRDGLNWQQLARIEAAGTTNQTTSYSVNDANFVGLSYYRLVQVDNDGQEEIFGPVSANCKVEFNLLSVKPNPASDNFMVNIQSNENQGNAAVELVDLSGRVILTQAAAIQVGSTQLNMDVKTIQPGAYIIRVKGDNDKFMPIRVVKL